MTVYLQHGLYSVSRLKQMSAPAGNLLHHGELRGLRGYRVTYGNCACCRLGQYSTKSCITTCCDAKRSSKPFPVLLKVENLMMHDSQDNLSEPRLYLRVIEDCNVCTNKIVDCVKKRQLQVNLLGFSKGHQACAGHLQRSNDSSPAICRSWCWCQS